MTRAGSGPLHVAWFQETVDGRVHCLLCPNRCVIAEGQEGACQVRCVQDGVLYSLVYGRPCSMAVDPIEKKPLYHFLPASSAFSYATPGCNLKCRFCQNHAISQVRGELRPSSYVPPELVAAEAEAAGSRVVAHTYTEPTVYFEYAFDVAVLARKRGLRNVFVTNGYIRQEPLDRIAPYLDAANVDLKSFRDDTYRTYCKGRLQPVLDTIARMHEKGVWVEVTTLVVPGLNDSLEELRDIARFIASVSRSTPWHVSRFHPDYRMLDRGLTPEETLEAAVRIGTEEGLEHIYVGNLRATAHEHTCCPGCRSELVSRHGFSVTRNRIANGCCPDCGRVVAGVWS